LLNSSFGFCGLLCLAANSFKWYRTPLYGARKAISFAYPHQPNRICLEVPWSLYSWRILAL
jgi:hypothetical protein